jgi:hypothetical protein
MFVSHRATSVVALLAALNMCIPWNAVAAQQPLAQSGEVMSVATDPALEATSVAVSDIALSEGGMLVGQVVDTVGQPSADIDVALIFGGEVVVQSVTDAEGRFAFAGVTGGTHQLATANSVQTIRAWAPQTAPPSALQVATLVPDETIIRGQHAVGCGDAIGCPPNYGQPPYGGQRHGGQAYGGRPVINWMRMHPGMVMAGIAAAIAIPVAIAASDEDDPHS